MLRGAIRKNSSEAAENSTSTVLLGRVVAARSQDRWTRCRDWQYAPLPGRKL
jgi:hypothetical protein